MSSRLRSSASAAVAALGLALAGCEVNLNTEGLTAAEKRSFTVSGQPDITLETFDGSIEIHSWDRNEVEVEVEKRGMEQALLDEMKIETEQDGDRITLRVKGPTTPERHGLTVGVHISPGARLTVAVPRRSLISARTGDGSIRVENVDGRATLHTDDGGVTVERVTGDIQIRSGDGPIRVAKAVGRLDLETDDGSITVDARPTVVRARTADGSIRLQVEPEAAMAEGWDLSTRDGSVTVTLPEPFDAEIDAETSDGSVRSSYPGLSADGEDGERRRRELRAKVGEGGPVLKIRTGDGTIRFER